MVTDAHGGVHPRVSFARFTETVRGRSRRLSQVELSSDRLLRRYLLENNLHRQMFDEKMMRSDAQRQRRRTTLLATDALMERDQILDTVSDGPRNPQRLIMLILDDLQLRQERLTSEALVRGVGKSLARIGAVCPQINRYISDILCLNKLDAGTLVQRLGPCCVFALLRDAVDRLAPLVLARGLSLVCTTTDDGDAVAAAGELQAPAAATGLAGLADVRVACDSGRILQVIGNLVGNAIKFSRQPATLRPRAACRADSVVFAVVDQSPDIAQDELGQGFERHYQVDRRSRRGRRAPASPWPLSGASSRRIAAASPSRASSRWAHIQLHVAPRAAAPKFSACTTAK